jgi:hypothetical protein
VALRAAARNDADAPIEQPIAALSVGSDSSNQLAELADLDGCNHESELYEEALKRTRMDVGEAYRTFFVSEAQIKVLRESKGHTYHTRFRPIPFVHTTAQTTPCRLLERCQQEEQEAKGSREEYQGP